MAKIVSLDKEARKAQREERKQKRLEARAERKANKEPVDVKKTLGIIGSYVAVATTAVATTLMVYTHMHSGGAAVVVDDMVAGDAPVEVGGAEV